MGALCGKTNFPVRASPLSARWPRGLPVLGAPSLCGAKAGRAPTPRALGCGLALLGEGLRKSRLGRGWRARPAEAALQCTPEESGCRLPLEVPRHLHLPPTACLGVWTWPWRSLRPWPSHLPAWAVEAGAEPGSLGRSGAKGARGRLQGRPGSGEGVWQGPGELSQALELEQRCSLDSFPPLALLHFLPQVLRLFVSKDAFSPTGVNAGSLATCTCFSSCLKAEAKVTVKPRCPLTLPLSMAWQPRRIPG